MVVSRASSSTFKSAPITGNYLQNNRSASSRKLSGDFDPALRDGDWGGDSDPGFRYALPWAIFVFSLRENLQRRKGRAHPPFDRKKAKGGGHGICRAKGQVNEAKLTGPALQLIEDFAEVPGTGFCCEPLGSADCTQSKAAAAEGVVANLKNVHVAGGRNEVLAFGVADAVRRDGDMAPGWAVSTICWSVMAVPDGASSLET